MLEGTKGDRRPRRTRTFVLGGLAGAAAVYFGDPDRGRERRTMTRDRVAGLAQRAGRWTERLRSRVESDVHGVQQMMAHLTPPRTGNDDVTLKHKIESEILRQTAGRINVDVADGTAVLRGEVDRPEAIRRIEKQVSKVPGIRRVETLLHLPETPPPDKQEAMRASAEATRRT